MPPEVLEDRARAGDVGAQVRLAARLDDQGLHQDAISWLSRAAQSGDAGALTVLGMRLLVGDHAPFLPKQGAGLLSDAAARGGADAAGMVAVLAGGGFHGPQSWTVALDYLWLSAELGGVAARDQLVLLADDPELTALAASPLPPPDIWRRLHQGVDVASWTVAPRPGALCASPRILAVQGLVPPAACDWVIEQSRPRLQRALVQDPETGHTVMGQTRTNQVANFELTSTNLLNLFVQARIAAAAGVAPRMMEAFAVLHYAAGEEASEHYDFLDPDLAGYGAVIERHGQRVATCLLYLNDGYDGGETAFPELGISHRGAKGDALIFFSVDEASGAPDRRTLHAGRPPAAGEKWVLSQFIRDRATISEG